MILLSISIKSASLEDIISIIFSRLEILGNTFIQFVCKNILHVHARRHPSKRLYVKDEDNSYSFIDKKNSNFQRLLDLSKQNIQSLITGKNKFYEYDDLKKVLENK